MAMTRAANVLFDAKEAVLLIGGAPVDLHHLKRLAAKRPVVAVDGGADSVFAAGLTPRLVLGDLDSIKDLDAARQHTRVAHIATQDTTDFEKALACVDAPAIIAMGFLGARFDHSLATLHALTACSQAREILLVGDHDAVMRVRGDFVCDLPVGLRFSVWPLCVQTFYRSHGLRYPLDGLTMQSGSQIGASNETCESTVRIEAPDGAGYLIITPLSALDALLDTPVWMPASRAE